MKRYILLTLLMVSVVTGLQAQTFKAYCPTKQEIECKILKDGKSVEIVKFTGRDFLGNLSVPSVVVFEGKTYKVTAIGKKALFSNQSLLLASTHFITWTAWFLSALTREIACMTAAKTVMRSLSLKPMNWYWDVKELSSPAPLLLSESLHLLPVVI